MGSAVKQRPGEAAPQRGLGEAWRGKAWRGKAWRGKVWRASLLMSFWPATDACYPVPKTCSSMPGRPVGPGLEPQFGLFEATASEEGARERRRERLRLAVQDRSS